MQTDVQRHVITPSTLFQTQLKDHAAVTAASCKNGNDGGSSVTATGGTAPSNYLLGSSE
nr:hypothetical protein [Bacteroidota bacterium]